MTSVRPLIVVAVALTTLAHSAEPESDLTFFNKMTYVDHVRHLASSDTGGRWSGDAGMDRAADYIRDTFAALGWAVEEQAYGCTGWDCAAASLLSGDEALAVEANAFSPACDVTAAAIPAATLDELAAADLTGKIALLHSFDIFSVPTTYADPKGLFLIEAMANGLPVVQPRHGAFPEIIARTGGGLMVPPEEPDALADALLSLLRDRARASALGAAAAEGVRAHYAVDHMAAAAEQVYTKVARTC